VKNKNGRKIGIGLMIFGGLLILAALVLFCKNVWDDVSAGRMSEGILPDVIEQTEHPDTGFYGLDMPVRKIGEYCYIGYLSIPDLNLKLPVMADWDYDQLKISPCRYTGSVKTDDLVIAAHNYSRHFGRIKDLSEGSEVIFTGMDGVSFRYEAVTVEKLEAFDIEEMTAGDYDLTLFTCTYGGKSRVTLRCQRTQEGG